MKNITVIQYTYLGSCKTLPPPTLPLGHLGTYLGFHEFSGGGKHPHPLPPPPGQTTGHLPWFSWVLMGKHIPPGTYLGFPGYSTWGNTYPQALTLVFLGTLLGENIFRTKLQVLSAQLSPGIIVTSSSALKTEKIVNKLNFHFSFFF